MCTLMVSCLCIIYTDITRVCRSLVRKRITGAHALGSGARSWTGWSEVSSRLSAI